MGDLDSLHRHPLHPTEPYKRRDFLGWSYRSASRTSKPVNHYILDFDLSVIYQDEMVRLKQPPWGGDRTVPEHLIPNAPPCDPFLVDVYCIGNIVRESFVEGSKDRKPKQGFEFMRGLISDMTNKDPTQRPTMNEVMDRFDKLVEGLDEWTLRSPVVDIDDGLSILGTLYHWTKQLIYVVQRLPAIPRATRPQL
ncbi:hypothetical protein H0H87_001938 [Tephrocybe sp. NHM501043]|nr:hypothetical protein H0H87_001938 [Tephrocybe sp. NHM501043]